MSRCLEEMCPLWNGDGGFCAGNGDDCKEAQLYLADLLRSEW